MGIEAEDTFASPEAVLNYSNTGLNGMRHNFHWLYQQHLIPKRFEGKTRPVLFKLLGIYVL